MRSLIVKPYWKLLIVLFAMNAIVCSLASAQTSPLNYRLTAKKGFVKIPFEMVGNNILVRFQINRSQPIWCILDTGANINLLDDQLAATLKPANNGTTKLNGGGGTIEGTIVDNAVISLQGIEAYRQRIALVPLNVLPQYFGRKVVGIIGTDFIKNFVIKIDHVNKTLTFYDYKTYNLSKNSQALPIKNIDNFPYTQIKLTFDGQNSVTADFEVDTGSIRSLQINRGFSENNNILNFVPKSKTVEGIGGVGVGGKTSFIDARIAGVQIGNFILKNPVISISQDTAGFGAGENAGVIGTEIFRRFTVILDYGSQKILLRPNKYFNAPFETDMSGLELVTGMKNFKEVFIKTVRANFPASRAGLQAGDEIISINGHSIAEFDLDKLSKMFRQAEKEYLLSIKRQDKVIKVRLKMERLI